MKIVLGSTSKTKKEILASTLQDLIEEDYKIVGISVDSGVSDQPLSEKEVTIGAVNRAKNALKQVSDADFAVGLEGGLHKVNGSGLFLICVAAIVDRASNIFIGLGGQLELPKEVSLRVFDGEQFGKVIREYEEKNKENKDLAPLLERLISRKQSFSEAIVNAHLVYVNKKHY